MRGRVREARGRRAPFQLALVWIAARCSRGSFECRRDAKSSVYHFHEISFFAGNDAFGLRHREIINCFGIGFQARAVLLIRCETVERDQSPGNIIRAFVWQEISDEMAAASG